jgi:hypothetical protein
MALGFRYPDIHIFLASLLGGVVDLARRANYAALGEWVERESNPLPQAWRCSL